MTQMAIFWSIESPEVQAQYARLTDPAYAREPFEYVFQMRIDMDDRGGPFWRRLQVPKNYTLWDFYVAMNSAIDWDPDDEPKFIGMKCDTSAKATVRGSCLWEHPLEKYFSLEHGRGVFKVGVFRIDIEMQGVLPRTADVTYPLIVDGERELLPDNKTFTYGEFDPGTVVFDDPDDKWIEVFCESAFAEEKGNTPPDLGKPL
jgi:hypothetical protein